MPLVLLCPRAVKNGMIWGDGDSPSWPMRSVDSGGFEMAIMVTPWLVVLQQPDRSMPICASAADTIRGPVTALCQES